jgi:hypothetical protein
LPTVAILLDDVENNLSKLDMLMDDCAHVPWLADDSKHSVVCIEFYNACVECGGKEEGTTKPTESSETHVHLI